jgi:hypothetical protein
MLGEELIPVKAAAHAAMKLADALSEVHREELDRTFRMLTERYGVRLPPTWDTEP